MGILQSITGVWNEMLEFFSGAFDKLTPIFYNSETGLTLIGVLSICGMTVGVCLLFLNMIKGWLRFGR